MSSQWIGHPPGVQEVMGSLFTKHFELTREYFAIFQHLKGRQGSVHGQLQSDCYDPNFTSSDEDCGSLSTFSEW